MKSFAERQAEKEARKAELSRQEQERHDRFIEDSISELGLDFTHLDDTVLANVIAMRVRDVQGAIAEHEYTRSFQDVLHNENQLSGDDLLRLIIEQNWILIQQNELISRLLSKNQREPSA